MGLMFARRRADVAKQRKANAQKAHAENHKKALETEKQAKVQEDGPKPRPAK